MAEWLCVDEVALRSQPTQFEMAAEDYRFTAENVGRVSDSAVTAAAGGFMGFEGAMADGFQALLRSVGVSLNDIPVETNALAAAFEGAAAELATLEGESDEAFANAQSAYAVLTDARERRELWNGRVARLDGLLCSARVRRHQGIEAEAEYQEAWRNHAVADRVRREAAADVVSAEQRLDELQVEFDRIRTDEDAAHDDVAAAIRGVDFPQGLQQCGLSDPGMAGMGVVIDVLDAAMINLGSITKDGAAEFGRLRSARNAIADFGGFDIAMRDDIVEREVVLAFGTPEDIRQFYLAVAFSKAGIDPSQWDPSLGLDHNREIVEDVYEYYAEVYRGGPEHLLWIGLAALVGPGFYAGFRDLETFADLLSTSSDIADAVRWVPSVIQPPALTASLTMPEIEAELRWYQEQFLGMQQEIFFDMAPAHEAYNDVGMRGIEKMFARDLYDFGPETIDAWQQIDDGRRLGDAALIEEGTTGLVFREQRWIIADDWNRMRDRAVSGEVVTYMMTVMGTPSVPGAKSYGEVFPWKVEIGGGVESPGLFFPGPLPRVPSIEVSGSVTVVTPLPDGNVANTDDRMRLTNADTAPAYFRLEQQEVLDLLEVPVGERASAYVLSERWDEILIELTDVEVDPDLSIRVGS